MLCNCNSFFAVQGIQDSLKYGNHGFSIFLAAFFYKKSQLTECWGLSLKFWIENFFCVQF